MKIAKTHTRNWVDYAAARGMLRTDFLSRFPFLAENKEMPEAPETVTEIELYSVIQYIDDHLQDEFVGMKAGNFLSLKLLGLIYQISMQTKNIGEALRYLSSFLDSTFPIVRIETSFEEKDTRLTLLINEKDARTDRLILENIITVICREISMMSIENVEFRMSSPFHNKKYPPYWEKGSSFSVSFPDILLKAQMHDRASQKLDVLLPKYLHLIESYKQDIAFSSKVKLTMLSLSDPFLPDINKVAQSLFITTRTLQRRLKDEDSSFRAIKEEIRKEIASALLLHDNYPVNSLAYILGYADASSLIHSFKGWFGVAPKIARESLIE